VWLWGLSSFHNFLTPRRAIDIIYVEQMNNKMNHIQAYSQILKIRTKFKQLQQLSWNINKLEQKYQIDTMEADELNLLYQVYVGLIEDLNLIYDELHDEYKIKKE
jgi:hypothetical protein